MHLVTRSSAQQGLRPGNHARVDPAGSSNEADPAGSAQAEDLPVEDGEEQPLAVRLRSYGQPRRDRRVNLRMSEEEYAALARAAGAAGLTPAGFATEAALAAARGGAMPNHGQLRQLLVELMAARTQVRRYGVNINQAVAQLHATGEAPGWLERATAGAERGVARLDAAARDVAGVLRRRGGR
jgi:hypothetical protein